MKIRHLFAVLLLSGATHSWAQYQGPSILSRSTSPVARDTSEPAEFRVHAGVNGVYESNVLLPGDDVTKNPEGKDLYGAELTFGALGSKAFKHTVLGLSYEGSYRGYTQSGYFNGSDHLVAFELQHQFNKKLQLTVKPTGGTLSRSAGGVLATSFTDASVYGVPSSELLDNRVYFTQGSADLTYQKSARLSFNFGGDGFFIRRQNAALVGVDGASARADVAYRLTRRQTIGAEYNYMHFTYDRAFGTYDANLVAAVYSNQFTSRWQLNLRGGGSRVESLGLQVIKLDPIVANILGTSTGIGIGYGVHYVPQFDAVVRRATKHGEMAFTYSRKLNPGNGILLLAKDEMGSVSVNQAVNRRFTLGFTGGVERLKGISEIGAGFDSFSAGGGVNYQVARYAYLTARLDWRQYELVNGLFNRDTYRAIVGLQFTSADTPIRIH